MRSAGPYRVDNKEIPYLAVYAAGEISSYSGGKSKLSHAKELNAILEAAINEINRAAKGEIKPDMKSLLTLLEIVDDVFPDLEKNIDLNLPDKKELKDAQQTAAAYVHERLKMIAQTYSEFLVKYSSIKGSDPELENDVLFCSDRDRLADFCMHLSRRTYINSQIDFLKRCRITLKITI